MMSITVPYYGKILIFKHKKIDFKVNLIAYDKKNLTFSLPLLRKSDKMLDKPRFLSLFSTCLINSIKQEHSCNILDEISSNVVCATSKASDQPAHTGSLIKAFASPLNIQ